MANLLEKARSALNVASSFIKNNAKTIGTGADIASASLSPTVLASKLLIPTAKKIAQNPQRAVNATKNALLETFVPTSSQFQTGNEQFSNQLKAGTYGKVAPQILEGYRSASPMSLLYRNIMANTPITNTEKISRTGGSLLPMAMQFATGMGLDPSSISAKGLGPINKLATSRNAIGKIASTGISSAVRGLPMTLTSGVETLVKGGNVGESLANDVLFDTITGGTTGGMIKALDASGYKGKIKGLGKEALKSLMAGIEVQQDPQTNGISLKFNPIRSAMGALQKGDNVSVNKLAKSQSIHPDDVSVLDQAIDVLYDKKQYAKDVYKGRNVNLKKQEALKQIQLLSDNYLTEAERDKVIQSISKKTNYKSSDEAVIKALGRRLQQKYKDAGSSDYLNPVLNNTANNVNNYSLGLVGNNVKQTNTNTLDVKDNVTKPVPSGDEIVKRLKESSVKGIQMREDKLKKEGFSPLKKESWSMMKDWVNNNILDQYSPINKSTEFLLNKPNSKLTKTELSSIGDPRTIFQMYNGIDAKSEQEIEDIFKAPLRSVSDNLDDLDVVMRLNRMKELISRNVRTELNKDEVESGIQSLANRLGPDKFAQLNQVSQQLSDSMNGLLKGLEGTRFDKKTIDKIIGGNKTYSTFEVLKHITDDIDDNGNIKNFGGSLDAGGQSPIKGFKKYKTNVDVSYIEKNGKKVRVETYDEVTGSGLETGNTLNASLKKAIKLIKYREKINTINSFLNLERYDEDNTILKKVKNTFKDNETPKGYGLIRSYVNGKAVSYLVPKDIEVAVKNLNSEQVNSFTGALRVVNNLYKAGVVTKNIVFPITNVIKDTLDASLNVLSKKDLPSLVKFWSSYPQAFMQVINKGDEYKALKRAGGLGGTRLSAIIQRPELTVEKLAGIKKKPKGVVENVKHVVNSSVGLIDEFNRIMEETTRTARYKLGKDTGESELDAAYGARNITIDFNKMGNVMKTLNSVIPFLNPAVQGTANLYNMIKENPKKATISALSFGAVPTTMLYMHNRNYEDYKDVSESEKQNYFIIMLRDRTADEITNNDKINAIKIPKGHYMKVVTNWTEETLKNIDKQDSKSLVNIAFDTINTLSPIGSPLGGKDNFRQFVGGLTPQVIKPALEQAINQNLYTGRKIVPTKLEGVDPSEQYDDRTSSISKLAGRVLNTSPLRTDALVKGYFGSVGEQAMNPTKIFSQTKNKFYGAYGNESERKAQDEIYNIQQQDATMKLKAERELKSALTANNVRSAISDKVRSGKIPREALKSILDETKLSKLMYEEYSKLKTPEEKRNFLSKQKQSGLLTKSVYDKFIKNTLLTSYTDRVLKSSNVDTRSKYLRQKLSELETKEEKINLLRDMKAKGILTKEVYKLVIAK
jgi:hypothetical protein